MASCNNRGSIQKGRKGSSGSYGQLRTVAAWALRRLQPWVLLWSPRRRWPAAFAPPLRAAPLACIPVELYRRFKDSFVPMLARLYTAISTLGQVPAGFTDGLITILFEAGERTDPADYRPITLLCTDYRLYAKVLALRQNPCLAGVIDQEQTTFVPGRRIGKNVLALQCLA